MYKVLVVDDEPIARQSIKILLSQRSDIELVCEAEDGARAINMLNEQQFDIVFLDIQMPKFSGIEIAAGLSALAQSPYIIFVTAYDQFAVEAFTLNALDYLLKPFSDERFNQAVDKVAERLGHTDHHNVRRESLTRAVELLHNPYSSSIEKLALRETGKIKLVDVQDIQYVKGAGNYVEIVLMSNKCLLHRATLKTIQSKLPDPLFARIHKSTIVRHDLIVELRPTPKGDYIVILQSGAELMMSRRNKELLDSWK